MSITIVCCEQKESESADSLFTMIDDDTEDGNLSKDEKMSLFSRIKGVKSETGTTTGPEDLQDNSRHFTR